MWQEPIVKDRVRTALEEGITSQAVAQAKRDQGSGGSILSGFLLSIRRLWIKETSQTREPQKSLGFQKSEETSR